LILPTQSDNCILIFTSLESLSVTKREN